MTPNMLAQPRGSTCTGSVMEEVVALLVDVSNLVKLYKSHHIEHSSWFVCPESLDHLEHIHHSLCLTAVNGGSYGTEHPTATHCVTVERCIIYTVGIQCVVYIPAMNQYWVVSSSPLNFGHLLNDISEHLQVGAGAIRRPVGHMELSYLKCLCQLQSEHA